VEEVSHEDYFFGDDAVACALEMLKKPKGERPQRLILSIKRDDVQLYIKVKDPEELEILPPDGTEVVEHDR
jgi:hypothetical protein